MTYGGGGGAGGTIASSGDVALSNPVNGNALTYNGTISKWTNNTISGAVDTSQLKAVVTYNTGTSSYPARPTGYGSVEWIGPVDPGSSALNGDSWLDTTI